MKIFFRFLVFGMVLLVAGCAREASTPQTVDVPSVIGLTKADAQVAITSAGLEVGEVTYKNDTSVPAGNVMDQTPKAKTFVAPGSTVSIVISSGPPDVTIPDIVGLSQDDAQTAILAAGLSMGTMSSASSLTMSSGKIISQTPSAGTSVAYGFAIDFVISTGLPNVGVPNVTGLTQGDAQNAFTAVGLTVGEITTTTSTSIGAGKIISQNPEATSTVVYGTSVNLVISSGLPNVNVPDVTGKIEAEARSAITSQGLSIGTVSSTNSVQVPAGKVISQSPSAGTSALYGSMVNFTISLGPPNISVPDVLGLNEAQARTVIIDAGLTIGNVSLVNSAQIQAGNVVSQDPTGGTSIAYASAVNLTISAGSPLVAPTFKSLTTMLNTQRTHFAACKLTNGTILLTGGYIAQPGLDTAEIYDPSDKSFTLLAAKMNVKRMYHTVTCLKDGTALIAGGEDDRYLNVDSAEIFDPVKKTFTLLPNKMSARRQSHTATLLPDGTVLLAGGYALTNAPYYNTAEIYDPITRSFTPISTTLTSLRQSHAAALLPNGTVLIVGGSNPNNSAEIYDPTKKSFTALSSTMSVGRSSATATLLATGKVLIAGGFGGPGPIKKHIDGAEIYDPLADTFTPVSAKMTKNRLGHIAALLDNGSVLLVGGNHSPIDNSGTVILTDAEIYDPSTSTFRTNTPKLIAGRSSHASALINDDEILVFGGTKRVGSSAIVQNTVEVFNTTLGSVAPLSSQMTTPRLGHTATRLANGKVLITGGIDGTIFNGVILASAELYDPSTKSFTLLANSMTTARHGHTATLLTNGDVFIVGGYNGSYLKSAEIFHAGTNTFTPLIHTMNFARGSQAATLLHNGSVLITGGANNLEITGVAELFDPTTETFSTITATPISRRYYHSATTLPDGQVLIAGGMGGIGSRVVFNAEIYDPIHNTSQILGNELAIPMENFSADLLPNGQVMLIGGDVDGKIQVYLPSQ